MPEGPVLTRAEGQACLAALDEIDCDYLVASGSLPRGVPDDFYVSVAEIAAHKGAKLVLDSSGDALKKATHHGVYLIKLSLGEMEQLVGRKLYTHSDQEAAVRAIVNSGSAEIVTLTLGRDGALLATRRGLHRLAAVKVEPKSTVGAGDSFLAAMTLGLAQGWSPEDTLARAAAAGTAALLRVRNAALPPGRRRASLRGAQANGWSRTRSMSLDAGSASVKAEQGFRLARLTIPTTLPVRSHRQSLYSMSVHQVCRFFNRRVRVHGNRTSGHDIGNAPVVQFTCRDLSPCIGEENVQPARARSIVLAEEVMLGN